MADPNELRDFQELYAELQRQNNRTPEYQTLGEKAEAFLTDPGDMSPQAVSTVKKLAGLNRVFYSATNNYDPARGKALHTIHEEARTPVIDTRNAAMSSVAELLDVPDVVARARPMQIVDENGRTVNGTFMMAAEGVDPNNVPKEASKINESAASGTNGNAFKQIADLQVLDYICGNVDRNSSNFFMKFNKKGSSPTSRASTTTAPAERSCPNNATASSA